MTDRASFPSGAEKERYVRGMFDAIAPRYDLLNRVMSANLDQRWRRAAARAAKGSGRGPYLDVGAGTGDLTLALMRAAPGARVVGLDIARAMLARGREKGAEVAQGSGLLVPARDATFEGITNAFVLRNLADLDAFFAEARRALQPGGKLVSLEIARPRGRLFGPLYRMYFFGIMPRMGRMISGNPAAYGYLADSVKKVEEPEQLVERMKRAGFRDVKARPMMRGAVVLFEATK
jgi:demethylmenaquinone methyltransferase / 2-methoxy-6-polyprenyl-1,4-benzoquinol methylase